VLIVEREECRRRNGDQNDKMRQFFLSELTIPQTNDESSSLSIQPREGTKSESKRSEGQTASSLCLDSSLLPPLPHAVLIVVIMRLQKEC
jgi:hypothetical protein